LRKDKVNVEVDAGLYAVLWERKLGVGRLVPSLKGLTSHGVFTVNSGASRDGGEQIANSNLKSAHHCRCEVNREADDF
jgi:hypothetical protein